MNPNNFFNPFGNNSDHPFNPFNPNFASNISTSVQNTLNQSFNPFGMFGQPQNQQQSQQHFPQGNPNVHVNNHYNYGNSGYDDGYYDDHLYYHNQGQNYQHPSNQGQSYQAPPKQEPTKPKMTEKELEILQAEKNPNSGHYYKRIGNEYYKKGMYAQAIENYTKAIQINDTETVFYSNRARSYKMMKNYNKAYEDAKVAIELDDKNIKGYLLCGQILAEMGKTEEGFDKLNRAVSRMTKALSLCAGQGKQEFEKDVQKNISRVKKVIFLKQESLNKQKKVETLKYIKGVIFNDPSLNESESAQRYKEIADSVGDLFAPAPREVPDHLCCKITMDLMEEPVITQSGITYEKSALNHHIQKNGNFDPVTRESFNPAYIFPNLTIKQATETFLKENPWAFETHHTDNYLDIKF